jgi:hypothetical protein
MENIKEFAVLNQDKILMDVFPYDFFDIFKEDYLKIIIKEMIKESRNNGWIIDYEDVNILDNESLTKLISFDDIYSMCFLINENNQKKDYIGLPLFYNKEKCQYYTPDEVCKDINFLMLKGIGYYYSDFSKKKEITYSIDFKDYLDNYFLKQYAINTHLLENYTEDIEDMLNHLEKIKNQKSLQNDMDMIR